MSSTIAEMRAAVESRLQQSIKALPYGGVERLERMFSYHLGWEGKGSGEKAQGKRIRPVMVLLCCHALGGEWRNALPAAAAVELVHNFSLIHDDIQDVSSLRRGRETVWVKWGTAQAINAGDAMLTAAFMELDWLKDFYPAESVLAAQRILSTTIFNLCRGQTLDMEFETRAPDSLDEYWRMVDGKTAALLSACARLGAVLSNADGLVCDEFAEFGRLLGRAFQAQDDLLGIWGDEAMTGKSAASDLLTGKKTLPVTYALQHDPVFRQRWQAGPIKVEELDAISDLLINDGARAYTEKEIENLMKTALEIPAQSAGNAGRIDPLLQFTRDLIGRKR